MNNWLLVGDMHAVVDELEQCQAIIDGCVKICEKEAIKTVVFLGDQHDTHAIVNLQVVAFWYRAFKQLREAGLRVIAIPGNHDYPGDIKSTFSSMSMYVHDCEVVEEIKEIDGVTFVPYFFDHDRFVEELKDVNGTIICHQTFDGSRYDNGFYAKGGIDQNLLSSPNIISGHIHTPAKIGKVEYIGAPRWRNANDCDSIRHLCIYNIRTNARKYISTESLVTPIKRIFINESNLQEMKTKISNDSTIKYVATISGNPAFCQSASKDLAGLCKIKTVTERTKTTQIKESEGLSFSIEKHLKSYEPQRCELKEFQDYAKKVLNQI